MALATSSALAESTAFVLKLKPPPPLVCHGESVRFSEWQTGRLAAWQTARLADWQTGQGRSLRAEAVTAATLGLPAADWQPGSLADWQTGRMADWQTRMADWQTGMADWQTVADCPV